MALKKPTARTTPSRKTLIWLVAATVIVLAIAGWFVFEQLAVHNDRLRFEDAASVKTEVTSRLVTYLGSNVISTREQYECFNAEQGPYDNGKLWCQVATVIRLKRDVDYASVAQQYVKFGQASGWLTGTNEPFTGSWIMKSKDGVKCQLIYRDGADKQVGLAASIPFTGEDHIALAITCADRAQAKYYPYTPLR
jgi:hypothetical protein